MSTRWCSRIGCLALLAVAAPAGAGKAAETFNSLFAKDLQRVKATRAFDDDEELATVMLDAVKSVTGDAALVELFCRSAHDLSAHTPKGFPQAVRAMETLRDSAPDKAGECDEKILAIRRRQYAAARGTQRRGAGEAFVASLLAVAKAKEQAKDYVEALKLTRQALLLATSLRLGIVPVLREDVKRISAAALMMQQITQMRARLKANPDDATARRRLIDLYLIDMDNPAEAAKYVDESVDEKLRTYIPLAGQDVEPLAAAVCQELGEWYRGLAQGTATAKVAMLERAKMYFESFLKKYQQTDLTRAKATMLLQTIETELAKLKGTSASTTTAGWHDVLKLVDPSKHAYGGQWSRKDKSISIASAGFSRIAIPVVPKGDYEMKVQFVRTSGDNDVNLMLPVGKTSVVVMLSGSNGQASGLSTINGKMCETNETRTSGKLENNKPHTLVAQVRLREDKVQITATLNGKKLAQWEGPQRSVSPGNWGMRHPQAPGLGADSGSHVTFQAAEIRMLSGTIERLDVRPTRKGQDGDKDDGNRNNGNNRWDTKRRGPPGMRDPNRRWPPFGGGKKPRG